MKAAVIRFPGSNCDQDCVLALTELGVTTDYVWHKESSVAGYDLVVLPGGFSYGDYLRCGAIARFSPIMKAVKEHAASGKLLMGICNGFQILCEAGLLPGALIRNRSLHFVCQHQHVRVEDVANPFLHLARTGATLRIPIAHGEGSYTADPETIRNLEREGRVLLRYVNEGGASIDSAAYAHFDRAASESFEYGELTVPAWGANTMRTEFAMLTGVPNEHLGYARFYPYAFVRRNCPSLASAFRSTGYRTRAIHPYHADFFGRDRAFPLLGFEHFIDIRHFDDSRRVGPYIGDAAVTDAIMGVLDEAGDAPHFIFAMTMENHGPLHLEAVEDGEGAALHQFGDERPWRDLTAYLRHVRNADDMIGTLIDYLRQRKRDTVLCFYGDHVPALPHVYERLGTLPERSNYFIWRNHGARPARQRNLAVEQLGSALQAAMDDGVNDKIPSDTWLQATER